MELLINIILGAYVIGVILMFNCVYSSLVFVQPQEERPIMRIGLSAFFGICWPFFILFYVVMEIWEYFEGKMCK